MLKFRCACGQKIGVPDSYVGHLVRCPRCAGAVPVPGMIDVSAEPVQPAPPGAGATAFDPEASRTFPFDVREELLREAGVIPTPPAAPATSEFGAADFSTLFGTSGGIEGAGIPLAPADVFTGAADVPGDIWGAGQQTEISETPDRPAQPAEPEDQRPLGEILGVEGLPPQTKSESSGQVADLLRDLSASAQEPAPEPAEKIQVREPKPIRLARQTPPSHIPAIAGFFSLLFGLAAMALCCLPHWTRLAVPAGCAGILLALSGTIVAGNRRRGGVALPVGGATVSFAGILFAIAMATGLLPLIEIPHAAGASWVPRLSWPSRIKTFPSARAGDIEVRVVSALVLKPALYDGRWSSIRTDPHPCLQITLVLKNTARNGGIEYRSWGKPRPGEETPTLNDSAGNPLKTVDLGMDPVGRVNGLPAHVQAGQKGITDVLLFEVPPEDAQDLELQLPGANIGVGGSTLKINIPGGMLKRQ